MTRFSRAVKVVPILWSSLVCFAIFTSYIIAVSMGHVYPFLPSISKTAAFTPEGSIFGFLLSFVALIGLVMISSRYIQLDGNLKDVKVTEKDVLRKVRRINKIALAFGVSSIVGIIAVGNFHSGGQMQGFVMGKVHDAATVLLLVSAMLYFWFQTSISYHAVKLGLNSYCMFVFRLGVSCTMTIAGAGYPLFKYLSQSTFGGASAQWRPGDEGYILHVANCSGEWIAILCLAAYALTFHREFQTISIDVCYVSSNETQNDRNVDYSMLQSNDQETEK